MAHRSELSAQDSQAVNSGESTARELQDIDGESTFALSGDSRSGSSPVGVRSKGDPSAEELVEQIPDKFKPDDFDASDVAAASSWAQSMHLADWLGPLAPVALSPFFGITCLSGMSIWGPDWMTDNALLGSSGPLRNHTLFWIFLVLTILTSIPRLTKVSKPVAQAADQLETYSVIVILLAIKFMSNGSGEIENAAPVAMVQMGIVSMTASTLLAIAMVINIIVINSVKFFFEFLVWLTPVPFLDAIFEACNKTACASLMAVYAFSPTLATVINLVILLIAAVILRWCNRRLIFYRTMMLDPVLSRLLPGYGKVRLGTRGGGLIVFPKFSVGPVRAKSRWRMIVTDSSKTLEPTGWLPAETVALSNDFQMCCTKGWVMHTVSAQLEDGTPVEFLFSRRFDSQFEDLVSQGRFQLSEQERGEKSFSRTAAEFA